MKDMPHGVCEKPQRRTAFDFSSEERFSGPLPRTTPRRYARRRTLTPQYIASSWAWVPPAGDVAPAHAEATVCRAETSDVCAAGAARPRTIAVRDWAIPMTRSCSRCPFAPNPALSCRHFLLSGSQILRRRVENRNLLQCLRILERREVPRLLPEDARESDRKSTRLNSSHTVISYA